MEWTVSLQLLLPGCNASKQHACHPACLQGWLARLKTSIILLLLILCFTPHPLLFRHSTCPVCRQTLAIEEEDEEGYGGGDESDDSLDEED